MIKVKDVDRHYIPHMKKTLKAQLTKFEGQLNAPQTISQITATVEQWAQGKLEDGKFVAQVQIGYDIWIERTPDGGYMLIGKTPVGVQALKEAQAEVDIEELLQRGVIEIKLVDDGML